MNEVTIYLANGKTLKVKMTDSTYQMFSKNFLSGGRTAHTSPYEHGFGANHEHIAFFTVKPMNEDE